MLTTMTIDTLTGNLPVDIAIDSKDEAELRNFAKDYKKLSEENERMKDVIVCATDAMKYIKQFERDRGGNWSELQEVIEDALQTLEA